MLLKKKRKMLKKKSLKKRRKKRLVSEMKYFQHSSMKFRFVLFLNIVEETFPVCCFYCHDPNRCDISIEIGTMKVAL